jgi:hypothetical protein
MTAVYWFTHGHEDRNDWLRFGFMRLHAAGIVHYEERPLADASRHFGFDPIVTDHTHRHTSVIALRSGSRTVRILADSEDSFFWMCPLISSVDLYFCAGYNRDFFVNRTFNTPYAWQTEVEVAFYRQRAAELIASHATDFHRVRPYAPIGPNLASARNYSWLDQKVRNLHFRAASLLRGRTPWLLRYLDFESRYRRIEALRRLPAAYDVVLQDTLWGWPRHRIELHRRLNAMSAKGFLIHSRLNWQAPMDIDGGTSHSIEKADFPMQTGSLHEFEKMLAASRLGVFATGFHYGWRNIVTFAMMLGLPIYCDPFIIEHYTDHRDYTFFTNHSGNWEELEALITRFRCDVALGEAKRQNQSYFDENLTPERVAQYVLRSSLMDQQ